LFNQNFGAYPNGYPQMQPQYPQFGRGNGQFVPSTNKKFVRSLEEALSLPADFNSQNVYFDVNQDLIYDICTNGQGEKSWSIFGVTLKQTSANASMASANVADAYEKRIKDLETRLEELLNGKHNAQQTDAAAQ
jgi:hypothetical protein